MLPGVAITATCRRTRSAIKAGRASSRPSSQWYSIVTFWPKQELKECIMAGINDVNRYPVIHTWSYKLAEAA
jgi:hypothetical protein